MSRCGAGWQPALHRLMHIPRPQEVGVSTRHARVRTPRRTSPTLMFRVNRLDHVALTVRDVQKSIAWYRDVFGLERRHAETWGDYPVMMCAGDTALALFEAKGRVSAAPDSGSAAIMRH